jgi:hypothetical protein
LATVLKMRSYRAIGPNNGEKFLNLSTRLDGWVDEIPGLRV